MTPSIRSVAGLFAFAALALGIGGPASAADQLKVGMLRIPQAIFVGVDQGYFAAEGIDVEIVFFRSGAEVVPSLSTGQIDVAITAPGASLFNALASGVDVTLVANTATVAANGPGGDSGAIVLRKDLADSGKVKSAADVKGMTAAITARGQLSELSMASYLKSGGLTEADVHIVNLPYPDMLAAMRGKAIDLAFEAEPFVTLAEQGGFATELATAAQLTPGVSNVVLMYGERLSRKNRDLGQRFMRAYAKSNARLRQWLSAPDGRQEIARVYQKFAPIKDAGLYQKIGLLVGDADMTVKIGGDYGLAWQLKQYQDRGLIPTAPDLEKFVDNSFVSAAQTK
jgi:NitT/TauT family transport system substrate-binding protein